MPCFKREIIQLLDYYWWASTIWNSYFWGFLFSALLHAIYNTNYPKLRNLDMLECIFYKLDEKKQCKLEIVPQGLLQSFSFSGSLDGWKEHNVIALNKNSLSNC